MQPKKRRNLEFVQFVGEINIPAKVIYRFHTKPLSNLLKSNPYANILQEKQTYEANVQCSLGNEPLHDAKEIQEIRYAHSSAESVSKDASSS